MRILEVEKNKTIANTWMEWIEKESEGPWVHIHASTRERELWMNISYLNKLIWQSGTIKGYEQQRQFH